MSEDTLINMIVNSFNSEFRTVDVHAYARKNGIIPIDIFTALNEAKHLGLIELQDNDFNTVKLTEFGERVKDVGGWLEYRFLDEKEQKKIKKPKKPKKVKEVKIIESKTKTYIVEIVVAVIAGVILIYLTKYLG
ncbi:hypothetical protein [Flavobacterium sp.]|uniref:hypothetical protein n=1 Tax=Flavobacterium sp. TaxID=239 RepID=UPI0026217BDE|nr:hypothetical protein [Flavobacterium sp.]